MRELVLVSGGFDPIHSGHIYLIQEASKYGDVIVLLNSDKDVAFSVTFGEIIKSNKFVCFILKVFPGEILLKSL